MVKIGHGVRSSKISGVDTLMGDQDVIFGRT
jgi:hypothetical protein